MEFTIDGKCPTKGSTRSFINPKTGKVVTLADNKSLKQWTVDARWQARAAKVPLIYKPHGVCIDVRVEFVGVGLAAPTAREVAADRQCELGEPRSDRRAATTNRRALPL